MEEEEITRLMKLNKTKGVVYGRGGDNKTDEGADAATSEYL